MAMTTQNWSARSAFNPAPGMTRRVVAIMRAHGALRYQCPATGSFVLVTDDATLASLAKPRSRVRCMGCGEMHLLTRDGHKCDPALIVPAPATP